MSARFPGVLPTLVSIALLGPSPYLELDCGKLNASNVELTAARRANLEDDAVLPPPKKDVMEVKRVMVQGAGRQAVWDDRTVV